MEKLSEMKPFLAEEMSVPQSIQDKVSELSSQLFNLTRKCACGCAKSATISHIRTNSGTEKVRDVRIVFSAVVRFISSSLKATLVGQFLAHLVTLVVGFTNVGIYEK